MPTRKGLDNRLRNAVLAASGKFDSKIWAELLRLYTSTKLTVEGDRLVAFSGIARLFEDESSGQYLAGLWSKQLHRELLWSCNNDDRQVAPSGIYVAPTWSWACLQSGIHYPILNLKAKLEPLCTIVEAVTTPIEDVFGQITSGYLCVLGSLFSMTLPYKDTISDFSYDVTTEDAPHELMHCLLLAQQDVTHEYRRGFYHRFIGRRRYYCWHGLLLKPTDQNPREFRRCGTFGVYPHKVPNVRKKVEEFHKTARSTGIPYHKVGGKNRFVVKII